MKTILILGAGLSSNSLIDYLEKESMERRSGRFGLEPWQIVVGDRDKTLAESKVGRSTRVFACDIEHPGQIEPEISNASLVISMLPAKFHPRVAEMCLRCGVSLFTASYESDAIKQLADEAKDKGVLFLNEMGLDPGLDHMSAMQIIGRIRAEGHELTGFESFTGGLIAPESDDNPWHYKFTWNPTNVVLAGWPGPARFIQCGKMKYIPYSRLFRRIEYMDIEGFGKFEGYANRDSLKYITKYNLEGIPTIYRGTLRRPGFSKAWDIFVQLGATDNSYVMENSEELTHREFINSFLYYHPRDSVEVKLYRAFHIDQDSPVIEMLEWLGIFSDERIGIKNATPAQILESILAKKWTLKPDDKDMVVMWHKFNYTDRLSGQEKILTSSMGVTGEDHTHTAMAKTVGLPLGIGARLYLDGKLPLTGVYIPTVREIYDPILDELKSHGITFREKELV
jgi:saccharopine dehydrogenase (NAD+, L-glutamate forming)